MMGLLDARLETIPALAGRVKGAADLSALVARNQLGQVERGAFTLPLGIRGGAPDAAAGLYRQEIEWVEGVLLVVRAAGDATGAAAKKVLEPLITAAIDAIAGWAPDDSYGVYRLLKGELVNLTTGTLTYQLDFAIEDQLRIAR